MNLSPTPMDTDLPSTTPTSGSLSPLPDLMDDADGTGSLDPLSLDAVIAIDSSLVEIGGGVEAWLIPSWTTLQADSRVSGPAFELGGYRWRLLLFPRGNKVDELSIYLESLDAISHRDAETTPKSLPRKPFSVCASFALALVNPVDASVFHFMTAQHRFTSTEVDWGFTHHAPLSTLCEEPFKDFSRTFVENDQLIIKTYVRVIKDETGILWRTNWDTYDSRTETGFVGITNQGATCYMNSLLQSLYFTSYFRKAAYQIPTESDAPSVSVALALQRLFYHLQYNPNAVDTKELTKSFGWDTLDSFHQHDVQEFSRVLQDSLENKMNGTAAQGALKKLFVGKMKSYIKCLNVNYESSREEEFYDISLNVKGIANLHSSFKDFCAVETMDGENKYFAEGHGLQDARKGLIFQSLPAVLHLQLKRFEYDFQRDMMVKVNDRFEYPETIDLSEFLSPEVTPEVVPLYDLHGVLVHYGDSHGGHYWSFIKPEAKGDWLKFDDDKVTRAHLREVMDESFGGDPKRRGGSRFSNAYMLVYIRRGDSEWVLDPVRDEDVPEHIGKQITEEIDRRAVERRNYEERLNSLTIRVLRDADIVNHQGFDLCHFEDVQLPATSIYSHRFPKDMRFGDVVDKLVKEFELEDSSKVRFWAMIGRQNKTFRVDMPIAVEFYDLQLQKILDKFCPKSTLAQPEIRLYLETQTNLSLSRIGEPVKGDTSAEGFPIKDSDFSNKNFLVFLKFFDGQKMHYAGTLYIPDRTNRIKDAIPRMKARQGIPESTEITIFEEVKPSMINTVKIENTWEMEELVDGDILVYQISVGDSDPATNERPRTAIEYFDKLVNRVVLCFKEYNSKSDASIELDGSRTMTYENVVGLIAKHIEAPPENILLRHVVVGGKLALIKRHQSLKMQEIMSHQLGSHSASTFRAEFLYEVLDTSVTVWETKRVLQIWFIDRNMKERGLDLLIPKDGHVSDIIRSVKSSSPLEEGSTGEFSVTEVINGRMSRVYPPEENVIILSKPFVYEMRREEIEFGVEEIESGAKLTQVYNFDKDPLRGWGIPFFFVFKPAEIFSETKKRIQHRLGLSDKEFAKIKVCVVTGGSVSTKTIFHEDDDVVTAEMFGDGAYGIDHPDKMQKSNSRWAEKSIKIMG